MLLSEEKSIKCYSEKYPQNPTKIQNVKTKKKKNLKILATHTSKAFKRYASEKRTEALRFDTIKQVQR